MKIFSLIEVGLLAAVAAGCGGGDEPARNFRVETTVSIPPGSESYQCFRVKVDKTVFASRITAPTLTGIHHMKLGIGKPELPDACASFDMWKEVLFAGSAMPQDLILPPGVAYPIEAGETLLLEMHLINAGDEPIDLPVGIDITGMPEAEMTDRAQLVEVTTPNVNLAPSSAGSASATCTLPQEINAFAVMPHMHYFGTHMKTYDATDTLYDQNFATESQVFQAFDPIKVPASMPIKVDCSYNNTSTNPITYGTTAADEMCSAVTYFYPAIEGQGHLCLR